MRISFFTEIGSAQGIKFPRNFENCRTDVSWAIALDAVVYNFDINSKQAIWTSYDLGIIIVPKTNPEKVFKFYERNKHICSKWSVMQEGPHQFYQDAPISTQIEYLNFLQEMDILFVHNEFDVKYYKGLFPHKKVSILPSLMIEDAIPVEAKRIRQERNGTVIGGNWCSWYSGQDSYFIAQELGEQMYAPSMGRKQNGEELIEEIIYLPYMNWSKWMVELNKMKYAVHLMRTWAAGTFSLNMAFLGVPCIGWGSNDEKNIHGVDTQRLLFPELTIPLGDMITARKIAKHLKENEQFYTHCSEYSKKMYNKLYSESIFIEKFKENISGI